MNSEEPIGIIELGNTNLKCLIFKIDSSDNLEILSTSITPSDGIFNDVITNLEKATKSIRLSISSTEKKAKASLKKINVVFEQPDFLCTKFSKHKKIDGSKIHRQDIEFLLKDAKKQLILNDKNQSIIHIFNHNYIVDGKIFVEEPIDVFANSLSHEMTFITAPKNNLKNISQVFFACDLEVEKLISRTFASGVKLLKTKELQFGCGLINLGLKKISLGLFKNLALVHSITFPLGTDHITSDISKVCSLDLKESENIRNNIDFSFKNTQNIFDQANYLKKDYFINSNFRKISKNLVLDVAKARLDEIFGMIKKQLIVPEFSYNSAINFLLTGKGLSLFNIEQYYADHFRLNARSSNQKNEDLDKDFTSCLGALKIIKEGWETEAIPEIKEKNIQKMGFFDKILNNFK